MTKLMFVQASPRSTESKSIEIAQVYLDALCAENPDLEIDRLDLWETDLPVFDGDKAPAKLNVILGNDQNAIQQTAWDQIGGIANRFISADRYLFAVSMWNGGVPYRLKQLHRHHTPTRSPLRLETGNRLFRAAGEQARDTRFNVWSFAPSFPSPAFGVDHHSTYLRAWLNQAGISAIDELRFQSTLLTSDPAGDLERVKQDAERLARVHGRIQSVNLGAV